MQIIDRFICVCDAGLEYHITEVQDLVDFGGEPGICRVPDGESVFHNADGRIAIPTDESQMRFQIQGSRTTISRVVERGGEQTDPTDAGQSANHGQTIDQKDHQAQASGPG